jgi:hypothetical protein
MFGNRLGWGISAAIYMVAAAFLWFVYHRGTDETPPTAVGENAASYTMKLDVDPRTIATWMTEDGSGADAYKEAIDAYMRDPQAYDRYDGKLDTPSHQRVKPALQALLKARAFKGPGVFADRKGALITYDADRPELKEALFALRDVAGKVGRGLQARGETRQAREIYEAMFTLGAKMWDERLVYDEMFEARQWLGVTRWLSEIADPAERANMAAFEGQFIPFFKKQVDPPYKALAVALPHTGDALALARRAGDPMWRVQAALALGRCKFTAKTAADQSGAKRELQRLMSDPDPRVALAAKLAHELTVEQFRILRSPI